MELDKVIGVDQSRQQLGRISRDFPDIQTTLESIYESYKISLEKTDQNGESIKERQRAAFEDLIGKQPYIYHVSSRLKSPEKVVRKIINRIFRGHAQYFNIDSENYYKIITDLMGFKLIHCFPDGWIQIDDLLYDRFYQGDETYVSDYCKEYAKKPDNPFMIQKPVVYYTPGEDLSMYRAQEEKRGKSLYEYEPRRSYRAVHYLINFEGIYTEIQVKTLSDELWSEIEHDLVYKREVGIAREELLRASDLLHLLLLAGDKVAMYMKHRDANNMDDAERYMKACREIIMNVVDFINEEGD